MSRPVIALLTDFGLRDHYAGVMKGVVLGICPEATLVDISHQVPEHDVLAGAFELAASFRYFPEQTIFLVVVDPGVGTDRRGIAAEAGGYRFVAPDNGVLSAVFDTVAPLRVVELTDPRYAAPTISRTFEGRDRFAPAAAWLATGLNLAALGPATTATHRLELPRPRVTRQGIDGEVLRVDRFGNLVTNIDRAAFEAMTGLEGIAVRIGGRDVTRLVSTYGEARPGELCALFSSSDHLEIAACGGSAAAALGVTRGAVVHVSRPGDAP